eukprot:PhM_4_TR18086/c0_g1_i4/m.102030
MVKTASGSFFAIGIVHAGDVPGVEHLPFVLTKENNKTSETGLVVLLKQYADYPETRSTTVSLRFDISSNNNEEKEDVFLWTNLESGAEGKGLLLKASQSKSTESSVSLCTFFCDKCHKWKPVGEVRMTIGTKPKSTTSCLYCVVFRDEPTSESDLQSSWEFVCGGLVRKNVGVDLIATNPMLTSKTTSAIVWEAFEIFSERPLFEYVVMNAKKEMTKVAITFREACCAVQRIISRTDTTVQSSPMMWFVSPNECQGNTNTNETNVLCGLVQLAAVAAGHIVVPLPPAVARSQRAVSDLIVSHKNDGYIIWCSVGGTEHNNKNIELHGIKMVHFANLGDVLVGDDVDVVMNQSSNGDRPSCGALLFTSGSSSSPEEAKAIYFPEHLVRPTEGLANTAPFVTLDFQSYDPTYILSLLQTIQCGGSRAVMNNSVVGICSGEAQILRPTHVGAPPEFWTTLLRIVDGGDGGTNDTQKKTCLLGDRVLVATTGGAPLPPTVAQRVNKYVLCSADGNGSD